MNITPKMLIGFIKEFMAMKVEIVEFKTSKDYEFNLKKLIEKINSSSSDFLLFPEVALSGFDYDNWNEVNKFGEYAIDKLSKLNKSFALTIIADNKNYFCFFDKGLVYKRAKFNLFGGEKNYFKTGNEPDIFEWNGLKIGNLICFELRFIKYWEKFKGVDLILVPSRWGKERIEHFKILSKALALSTQSNVLVCNSANEEAFLAAIDAWADGVEGNKSLICEIDLEKNKKIRKKLNIGIV